MLTLKAAPAVQITPEKNGFTLIELSIVLVIIGLIVGGILVGRDLIKAAEVRAQVTQIEKYNTAVNTFRGKYGYLPGDIPNPYAPQFGFASRGSYGGQGDGNGVIQGNCNNTAGSQNSFHQGCGEAAVFWEDLSEANLIDVTVLGYDVKGTNYPGISTHTTSNVTSTTIPNISNWIPTAKIGQGNYIYVYSNNNTYNYFGLSSVDTIGWTVQSSLNPGITVAQAAAIDSKMDDGSPQSGNVVACYVNYNIVNYQVIWAAGGQVQGAGNNYCSAVTTATPYLSTNCYDNGGVSGPEQYSLAKNASLGNCALSFRFQ